MTRSFLYLFFLLIGLSIVFTPRGYDQLHFTPIPVVLKNPVDLKQVSCMARNIYYEAGSEALLGQAAVARVVINRMNHGFARTPCEVIYQSAMVSKENDSGEIQSVKVCQFSWVCAGVPAISKNHLAYKQAEQIAYDVLANDAYNGVISKSTLFFHSILITPNWAYKQMKVIGNHLFYAKGGRPKPVALQDTN